MEWRRGQTIGRGSSATVSIAACCSSGEIFAVKSAELSCSELLQREEKFLCSLSSPHIVSYKGCDITSENHKFMYNLKMEYVAAGTLIDVIRKKGGGLDEAMIKCYTQQILQGLEYLHSSGVAHCDIKATNILVGDTGAKIADLGCAKWVDSDSDLTETMGGTPMFMAPEVARGEEQSFAADIWSLGCTIIEMASGGSPWPNISDPMSVLYQIAYSGRTPDVPEYLSHQAKDFVGKCLQRDPKERWTVRQLLKHPFLEEFRYVKNQNFLDNNSPTSILDQGVWNSIEEVSETSNDVFGLQTKYSSSCPDQRITRFLSNSRVPNWTCEETWITIRDIVTMKRNTIELANQ
ncbi:Protein kinase domain-containing protein [Heracleum sosnowskyi]|uniref:Protein kinase domain-containing protein n=1 Tax=Heracleum sosnowskyi TaxID=360622 RepID=A0AAD8GT61_9APIA|nr:Protein kinase domain-containing protein [Heracleum sosnowskyi]